LPGRPSLAETATLDAGLAQQLTVLLLCHTLAALLDHGAHTKSLSKPCGVEPGAPDDAALHPIWTADQARRSKRFSTREPTGPAYMPCLSRAKKAPPSTIMPARR